MLIALWSTKGGVGVTVTTLLTARRLSRRSHGPVLIVDLDGDVPMAAGIGDAPAGLAEWTRLGATARPDTLERLVRPIAPDVDVLPRGTGPVDLHRVPLLLQLLRNREIPVLIDLGRIRADDPGSHLLRRVDRSLLVTRSCYLALRRGSDLLAARRTTGLDRRPDGLIVIVEPGRALSAADVSRSLDVSPVVELPIDASLARMVDAGLLLDRPHRAGAPLDRLLTDVGAAAA